jgi:triosephosphate isomerase
MNHGPTDAAAFLADFLAAYPESTDRHIIFFPPAVSLATVSKIVEKRRDVSTGVQNIYRKDSGAFTGEVSAPLARQAGATYCLVGHSERRNIFLESDDDARKKVVAALRSQLTPVLCVGEARSDRASRRTAEVVGRQLRSVISGLEPAQVASLAVAYEPLWAIGTGENATPEDASEVHRHIRYLLKQSAGAEVADNVHILYGGSVNSSNAAALLAAADVDGLLVGGASLQASTWIDVVRA